MLDSCSDDCGQVRRKIRLLQKTPGWKVSKVLCVSRVYSYSPYKVTEWLSEIGINSNSYGRFSGYPLYSSYADT